MFERAKYRRLVATERVEPRFVIDRDRINAKLLAVLEGFGKHWALRRWLHQCERLVQLGGSSYQQGRERAASLQWLQHDRETTLAYKAQRVSRRGNYSIVRRRNSRTSQSRL